MDKKKIILIGDHGGFELKEKVKAYLLKSSDFIVEDMSPKFVDLDDYPDICIPAAKKVVKDNARGIFICGTGAGMCICANKVKGIRAAPAYDEKLARLIMQHNDANVLCLGGRVMDEKKAITIVRAWLSSSFLEGRYSRRNEKIAKFESEQ
ncbi:MAG: RpiB/LacA/LacB family sugar-phosphate isomerase [archaeon]